MRIDFTETNGSLPEGKLLDFEEELGVRLPEDYRGFLLSYNGGRLHPEEFPIPNCPIADLSAIGSLFGVDAGWAFDIRKYRSILAGRIPPWLLPIGNDQGGNVLCLAIATVAKGQVSIWLHEYEDPLHSISNVYPLTDSFTAFLNTLQSPT